MMRMILNTCVCRHEQDFGNFQISCLHDAHDTKRFLCFCVCVSVCVCLYVCGLVDTPLSVLTAIMAGHASCLSSLCWQA